MRDKKAYDIQYVKNNCKVVKLLLNKNTDQDILKYLEGVTNKNLFLKDLIREEMKKGHR